MWWCSIEMRLLRDHRLIFFLCRRSVFPSCFFGFIRCPQNQLYVFCFSRIISNVCEALLSSTSARSTSLVFFPIILFHPLFFSSIYFLSFQFVCSFIAFCLVFFITFLYLILLVVVFVSNLAFYTHSLR